MLLCSLPDGKLVYINLDELRDDSDSSKLDLEKINEEVGGRAGLSLERRKLEKLREGMVRSAIRDMAQSDSVWKRNKQPRMPYRIGRK
jgi:hypothetical protein